MAIDWSKTALPTTEGGYDALNTEDQSGLLQWLDRDSPVAKLKRMVIAKMEQTNMNAAKTADVAAAVADL